MTATIEREREELHGVVSDFLTRRQDIAAVRRSLDGGYDRSVWGRMTGELGLAAVGLPEEVGGTGTSLSDLIVITEELGRHLDPGPFVPSVVLGARVLVAAGADPQWIERIIDGSSTVSFATSHPHGRPSLVAQIDHGQVVVDGTAQNVLLGDCVDDVIVVVAADVGPTLVRVGLPSEGVTVTAVPTVDGTRPLVDLEFSEASAEVLGQAGAAIEILAPVMRSARIALAAELVGVAQGALDLTVEHALTRHQFGRAIGSFQSIKHALVDVMMDLEASRAAVHRAAAAVDEGDPAAEQLSLVCQAVASDAAVRAGKAAIQVHGAIGFTWEHDAHLFLKRAMSGAQFLGSARDHRRWLADLLLDDGARQGSDDLTPHQTPERA